MTFKTNKNKKGQWGFFFISNDIQSVKVNKQIMFPIHRGHLGPHYNLV
jgi:hypothetical protein